jgi:hypothetical protein
MYSTAVQISKTYENYLELSWIQVLLYFCIYVMVSRIDSCFFGGVTTHGSCTPGLQEIPFEFLMNFLWHFMIFFCIFKKSLCSSYAFLMHILCNSFAFLMQFFCISYAILLQFLCISYAFLMHFLCSSYAVLKTSYTFAKTAYTFAQNVWSCKNCIRIA